MTIHHIRRIGTAEFWSENGWGDWESALSYSAEETDSLYLPMGGEWTPPVPPPQFGPEYPDLGARVAKLRKAARTDPALRRAHGLAVLDEIGKRNARLSMRDHSPVPRSNSASGTFHNTGAAILKAVREQLTASLHRALADDHRRRTDDDVRRLYAEAMAAKAARERS